MPDISTNISYLGVRGFQRIPTQSFNFVYQFEAGIDISANPGDKQSNSNLSNQVNGALFSRNSYIGLASSSWGAIRIGKSDGPYKNSTAQFNPFSGMWGDYSVIMGNSGGDNRVSSAPGSAMRSGTSRRLETASTSMSCLRRARTAPTTAAISPRANAIAPAATTRPAGENTLVSCSDGAFSNAVSTSPTYTNGPLYVLAAYEFHHNVNRSSDLAGACGVVLWARCKTARRFRLRPRCASAMRIPRTKTP